MAGHGLRYDETCETCKSTFPTIWGSRYGGTKAHLTVGEIQASSTRGCHAYCSLIVGLLRNNPDCAESAYSPLKLDNDVRLRIRCDRGCYIYVETEGGEKTYGNFLVENNPEPDTTGRPEYPVMTATTPVHLVKEWIFDCESGHPNSSFGQTVECTSSSSWASKGVSKLPTRLLNIDRDSESGTLGVRLVHTHRIDVSTSYTTWSYCWGGDVPSKCTSANLPGYLECIPFDALPRTIRESILLTESLGIRYIWIDSLCIIQDSIEDWMAEASQMSHVYAGSFLNIAADAATTSEGGIFTTRNPLEFAACKVGGIVFWRDPEQDGKYRAPRLHTRGWCFQERYLPPRTIHFGGEQFHWECATHSSRPEGFPGAVGLGPGAPKLLRKIEEQYYSKSSVWERLIEDYSTTTLTKSSDKLIAIAGLASRYSELCGPNFPVEEYLLEKKWGLLIDHCASAILDRSAYKKRDEAGICEIEII